MPAKNLHHDAVVCAPINDGWTITNDPLTLSFGGKDLYVDLAAERMTIAAERAGLRIAVEIQSFLTASPVRDLEEAVGQFEIYRAILTESEPDRRLYMAVPKRAYGGIFSEVFGQFVLVQLKMKLLVFDETQERVVQWID